MFRSAFRRITFAVATTLTLASVAAAQTVSGTAVFGPGIDVEVELGPEDINTSAGKFTFTQDPLNNNVFLPNSFTAFCIELDQFSTETTHTYQVKSTNNLTNGGYVAWLYNTFAPTVTTELQFAGLQVAIWEARYDGNNVSLTSGTFELNNRNDVKQQALVYLNQLGNNTSEATWLKSSTKQDFIAPLQRVPEPGTFALLALGGVFLAAQRARRK